MAQGIRQRVAALPAVAREVLGAAAVVGRVASRGLLVRVVAQPEEEVLTALDAACRVRLLQENGSDRYQFVHDVIREVAEADLGAGRRTVLHRRIGEALEAEPGASLERLAYHYARSDDYEKAVLYLAQAGDRAAAQYAHAAAESYYREVADRLDTAGRANDAAHVRQKLGAVLSTIGRYDAALAVLERAADTYHTVGDLERLGQTMAQIGRAHADRGTPDTGIAAVQPLLERLAGTSAHARAALYTALAHLYFVSGRCEEQLRVAERAAELLRAVGERAKLAAAMSERGQALFFTGRPAEALHAHNEALGLAEETGDLATLCHALYNGAFIYWDMGEFRVAFQRTERALAVAEQLEDPALIVLMAVARGEVWRLWGEWAQARADFERALAAGRQLPGTWHIAYALLSSAELSLWQGEWETAARCLEECRGVAERSGHVTVLAWSEPRLAELDLQEGHPEAARDRLRPLLGLAATHDLARAYLELGDVAEASEVAAQCTARARAQSSAIDLVEALLVEAMVLAQQGRWAEAEQSLEEGLDLARRMPYPYAEARLLHLYGEMHAQKGESEPARERLEAALALFRRLGARKDVERVAQALSTVPSVPPRAAAGPARPSLPTRPGIRAGAPAGRCLARRERHAWALEYLRTVGPLSPRAYATALAVSIDTALLDLRDLVARGLVRAEGRTKNRRYVLTGTDQP